MKKTAVLLVIQIVVIGLVLALTIGTIAWFNVNMEVKANRTFINSIAGDSMFVIMDQTQDFEPYKGQTGVIDPLNPETLIDAPYSIVKHLFLQPNVSDENSYLYISFPSISITMLTGEVISSTTDSTVIPAFTYRLALRDELGNLVANYRPSNIDYCPVQELADGTTGDKLRLTNNKIFIDFTFIYLDEASYVNYQNKAYESVTEFLFSDYKYMRAVFGINFEVGLVVVQ